MNKQQWLEKVISLEEDNLSMYESYLENDFAEEAVKVRAKGVFSEVVIYHNTLKEQFNGSDALVEGFISYIESEGWSVISQGGSALSKDKSYVVGW